MPFTSSDCRIKYIGIRPWTTGDHNSAGTPDWPSLVSPSMVSVFVGRRLTMTLLPPAIERIGLPKRFIVYSDVPHTHTLRNTPKGEDEMRWNENSWFRLLGFRLSPVAIQESFKLQTKFYAGTRIGVPILFQLISVASLARMGNQSPCPLLTYPEKQANCNVLIWRCNEAPDSKGESCIELHNAAVSEIVQFSKCGVMLCPNEDAMKQIQNIKIVSELMCVISKSAMWCCVQIQTPCSAEHFQPVP